jgi:hypothetical protein
MNGSLSRSGVSSIELITVITVNDRTPQTLSTEGVEQTILNEKVNINGHRPSEGKHVL